MAPIILSAPMQGWALPVSQVPDAVFAEAMLGDGVAIDPTGDGLYAPCDATVLTLLDTNHAITLRTRDGAEILIHIGLDTVALGGRGFTPRVAVGDTVASGDLLIGFDLDLLVREARAVVTPIIVINPERFTITTRTTDQRVEIGTPLMTILPIAPVGRQPAAQTAGEVRTRTFAVPLPHGIHARPAARLGELAKTFASSIRDRMP
ncbi:glucose PTS transporter subunit IIA [Sphingomonas sp. 22R3R2A-7]|uniref:glucose PTS transporter subunit IIA n=1 Tax=Sphingomonas sp. 22R3R2A-7 TaxID=3050230 RepID=UPI002FE107F1